MSKNTNKTKKFTANFNLTDSLIEKHKAISVKLKIRISQLIGKILLKQRSIDQIRHCLTRNLEVHECPSNSNPFGQSVLLLFPKVIYKFME